MTSFRKQVLNVTIAVQLAGDLSTELRTIKHRHGFNSNAIMVKKEKKRHRFLIKCSAFFSPAVVILLNAIVEGGAPDRLTYRRGEKMAKRC